MPPLILRQRDSPSCRRKDTEWNVPSRMPKINAEWETTRYEAGSRGTIICQWYCSLCFMLEQRLQHQADIPLLSCPDVATLLKSVLPRKDITEDEVLRQLEVRHRKKQASTDAACRKQQKDGLLPLAACSPK